ncbi:MAG: hydrogenase formation protein HypD [candidate division Zixibacteria bacterium]|nr:hydrogenase formation protein HypD [candidate division Zixibacteria bacterium]MBU1469902.1 hydrogenase formation protein HypD [candidate division Zixibacteria bacterium]MBU2623997.1 hydrogenase formation protein HypD [candidate division Zixibacteria bacterium]
MKFIDEFRDSRVAARYIREIEQIASQPWTIMEICGGQTHTIVRNGIDRLLPEQIRLLHGPGCPVCITPANLIDKAIEIALQRNVIFCSFGDMLRVPGSTTDLLLAKAAGADVRVVYSPLDSVSIALKNPKREVVFFGIGFETTAPAVAVALRRAKQLEIANYSVLPALALVPPAIETLLSAPACNINGFLAAGHVCTVMGYRDYEPIAESFGVPIVVTGFEPIDILQGIHMTIAQLEQGVAMVENQYSRAVRKNGNSEARKLMGEVFCTVDRDWRGLGRIKRSGLALSDAYAGFDVDNRFTLSHVSTEEKSPCISGLILQGRNKPYDCAAFGNLCTPQRPLGATMVSSEGACAAYYRYRRHECGVIRMAKEEA